MIDAIQDAEDWLTGVIDSSLGPDWTPRDAARHILNYMIDERAHLVLVCEIGSSRDC